MTSRYSPAWEPADRSVSRRCGGSMPRGPTASTKACSERTDCVGCGECYIVDSTLSNNWRMLRTIDPHTGEDSSYIE